MIKTDSANWKNSELAMTLRAFQRRGPTADGLPRAGRVPWLVKLTATEFSKNKRFTKMRCLPDTGFLSTDVQLPRITGGVSETGGLAAVLSVRVSPLQFYFRPRSRDPSSRLQAVNHNCKWTP